jgi:capsular exopolysaccharide synthesis family protein
VHYNDDEKLGLAHYLTKRCDINDVIYATNLLRAYYIPAGFVANNSLALLNAARFRELLEQISHLVEYIIIDAPPIGMIVDAMEIAKSCDGAVFVVGYNQVHRKDLLMARHEIEKTGCEVLGTVINNVPLKHYRTSIYQKRKSYRGYDLE